MSAEMKRFILKASATYTAADAGLVGDWIDVSGFNELYLFLDVSAFASRANETLVATVERKNLTVSGSGAGYTNIATFSTINTAVAQNDVQTVNAATGLIGGKIRCRIVLAGTWSSKSMTFEVSGEAKKA